MRIGSILIVLSVACSSTVRGGGSDAGSGGAAGGSNGGDSSSGGSGTGGNGTAGSAAGGTPGTGGIMGSGGSTTTCDPASCVSSPPCVDRACSGGSCVETFHDNTPCGGDNPCYDPGTCSGGSCQAGAAKPDGTTSGSNFCCGGTLIGPNNPVYCGSCQNNCLNGNLKCCCGSACCASNPDVACYAP